MNQKYMPTPPFSIPISVIVPAYNAPLSLKNLITSLGTSVPQPLPGLTFQFIDDGSPDPAIQQIFTEPFFSRSDVRVELRCHNLGFILTVNEGISKAPRNADLVLLNSDTEIWTEVFSTLQEEAYSDPHIASVTPLTNNGTIASLFSYPSGGELPPGISARQVATTVAELQIPTPRVAAPTGVGFCLYMKRAAIEAIGLFNPIYGKGYGEECDWSRQAIAQGWTHLISTRTFVYHSGTQSFPSETKRRAVQQNGLLLNRRFPEYDFEVARYVRQDPLWLARIEIGLNLIIQSNKTNSPLSLIIAQATLRDTSHTEIYSLTLQGPNASLFTLQERFHPNCLPLLLTFLKTFGDQLQVEVQALLKTEGNGVHPLRSEILFLDQISKERDELSRQLTQLGGANSLLFKFMKFMVRFKIILDRFPLIKKLLRNTFTLSWRFARTLRRRAF